ncbi:hypothetical protein OA177_01835, partial [Candidatus Pelagibacter sp.]|nr:hypothetical protein [Candidatus Pelagibacter sp.]
MYNQTKVFLGINVSHGASAALMVNGELKVVFQEERFNKIKNYGGYPKKSIDKCIEFAIEKKLSIDEAAFSTINNHIFNFKYQIDNHFTVDNWLKYYLGFYDVKDRVKYIKRIFGTLEKKKIINHLSLKNIKEKDLLGNFKLFRNLQKDLLEKQSKGIIKKISFLDHHMCHAYYAAHSPRIKSNKFAVVTLDSEGDSINQTLWICKNKKLKRINKTTQCDLARIYRFITIILKMRPLEHEYKVMGLAPYSKGKYATELYNKVFKNILKVSNCKVIHKNRPKDLFSYLYNETSSYRFDNIAGAAQILVEQISSELLKQINKKYKVNIFSLSGGVSMNIKMNRNLANLKFVKKLYVSPTGTDDSLCVGACYYLNKNFKQKPLKNIYLGQNISDNEINKKTIRKHLGKLKVQITENVSHLEIAKLIKNNEIIAVARGREEFGARALGNRSILANPKSEGVVQKINEQIKNRDFWMPFALTILKNKHKKYLSNNKNISSEFMTIGFDTKDEFYDDIKNGTHPYDRTVRPQILEKEMNPNYYSIINNFYKMTKIPA